MQTTRDLNIRKKDKVNQKFKQLTWVHFNDLQEACWRTHVIHCGQQKHQAGKDHYRT